MGCAGVGEKETDNGKASPVLKKGGMEKRADHVAAGRIVSAVTVAAVVVACLGGFRRGELTPPKGSETGAILPPWRRFRGSFQGKRRHVTQAKTRLNSTESGKAKSINKLIRLKQAMF